MYYRGLAQAADTDVLPIKSVAGVGWGGGGGGRFAGSNMLNTRSASLNPTSPVQTTKVHRTVPIEQYPWRCITLLD